MLENLKSLLGFTDTSRDVTLSLILEGVKSRLKLRLGGIEPPAELEYIIVDVALVRFNRIGSEGFQNHSVEGESMQFKDSDFDGYEAEIQAFLESQKGSRKGKVRFL